MGMGMTKGHFAYYMSNKAKCTDTARAVFGCSEPELQTICSVICVQYGECCIFDMRYVEEIYETILEGCHYVVSDIDAFSETTLPPSHHSQYTLFHIFIPG